MRNFLLGIFIFIVSCKSAEDQYFQGKVHYRISYQSHMEDLPEYELESEYGSASKYYFKKGNFREISNGYYMQKMVYNTDTQKVFYKHKGTEYWESENVSINNASVDSFRVKENADSVLGIPCHRMYFKNDKGTKYYYYSPELAIKPEWFKGFKKGNKDFVAEKTAAIPLKTVMVYIPFTVTVEAVKIERKKVSDSLFTIED